MEINELQDKSMDIMSKELERLHYLVLDTDTDLSKWAMKRIECIQTVLFNMPICLPETAIIHSSMQMPDIESLK